jgi:RNA polymerase sigma factor (sigma-70 family)
MPELIYFFPPDCNCVGIFERIYYEWNRTLFVHVRQNADFDLAREICQQVWTEMLQAVRARKYTFLTPGLLVSRADSRLKDHYRRATRFPQFDPALHDVSDTLNLDERIDHKTALSALPDNERNVFTHFFREGLSQAEIAERLSISTRTVRRKLNAAFTHLQEFLKNTSAVQNHRSAK